MKPRYVVAPPIPGGTSDWEITDKNKDEGVVWVHKDFPNAEEEVKKLCERANKHNG